MTKLTKKQKVLNFANNKKCKNISHLLRELNYFNEKELMYHLRRLRRQGLINYQRTGQKIKFNLTQIAYYNRALLID
jgi:predicted transcriptional regulator